MHSSLLAFLSYFTVTFKQKITLLLAFFHWNNKPLPKKQQQKKAAFFILCHIYLDSPQQ